MKRPPMEWGKNICKSYIYDKLLMSEIPNKFTQLNSKETTQVKSRQKLGVFSKMTCRWPTSNEKVLSVTSNQGNKNKTTRYQSPHLYQEVYY